MNEKDIDNEAKMNASKIDMNEDYPKVSRKVEDFIFDQKVKSFKEGVKYALKLIKSL